MLDSIRVILDDTVLTLHTVSVVVVHVVLTPRDSSQSTLQVVHGKLPEFEKVAPATHGHVGVSAAQSVS